MFIIGRHIFIMGKQLELGTVIATVSVLLVSLW